MPTGPDLINIDNLALSDTFNTWFVRTNEIIDNLNPLQVYDVYGGVTSGISVTNGGFTNGIAYLSVNIGPGLGINFPTGATHLNKVVVDFATLTGSDLSLTTNPAVNDLFIVNDSSDTTMNSTGTPKRIPANRILPSTVIVDPSLTIDGDLYVSGDLTVAGSQSYLATNDLRVEDFQIEIAYQLAGYVGVTGVTSGTYTDFTSKVGATAYFAPTGITADSTNATVIGYFKSATGPAAGPTAQIKIGSVFQRGTPDLLNVTGSLKIDGIGLTFTVVAVNGLGPFGVLGATTDFVSDSALDEAGFVVKGASGDKSILWYDTDNAFITNQNLGVEDGYGIQSTIYSYRPSESFGNGFRFATYGGDDFKLTFMPDGTGGTNNYQFTIDDTTPDSASVLRLKGIRGATEYDVAQFNLGSTGPNIFAGVAVSNWSQYLNSDQLDGAHGYTGATAYGIPIGDQYGFIDSNWTKADRIVKKFTQASHGFTVGTVVRYDVATNRYQKAYCDTAEAAETIGVVEKVDGNTFWVNMQGYISGLSLGTTGVVYFLAQQGASGGLITDPSTLVVGDIQKAILYSISTTEAIVLGHPGVSVEEPTDEVYLNNAIPVGSIYPYAGSINRDALSRQGWLVCDGKRYYASDWTDLHTAIGQQFYADGRVVSANGESFVEVAFSGGDTIGFVGGTGGTGESILIQIEGATAFDNYKLYPIAAGATTIKVDGLTTGNASTQIPFNSKVRVYGRDQGLSTVFLVPDMRRRTVVGASREDGLTGTAIPALERGDVGGYDTFGLTAAVFAIDTSAGPGSFGGAGSYTAIIAGDGATGGLLDNKQPFGTVNYIIRAKKGFDAVIITGHNHDMRYIRFDGTHDATGGAGYDLTDADRARFRANAKVLRNDSSDTFNGNLNITGSLSVLVDTNIFGGLGVNGTSQFSGRANFGNDAFVNGSIYSGAGGVHTGAVRSLNVVNAYQGTFISWTGQNSEVTGHWQNAGIKVLGGDQNTAEIAIFNSNANGNTADQCSVSFWGIGTTSIAVASTYRPRFIGAIVGDLQFDGTNLTRSMNINIGGRIGSDPGSTSAYESALSISRTDNTTEGIGNGSIKYRLPKSLPTAPNGTNATPVVIDENNQLQKAPWVGGPKFIGPHPSNTWNVIFPAPGGRSVANATSDPWQEVSLVGTPWDQIPSTATALIIEFFYGVYGPDSLPAPALVYYRPTVADTDPPIPVDQAYILFGARAAGEQDAGGGAGNSTLPWDAVNRRFYWRQNGSIFGSFGFRVIGYY